MVSADERKPSRWWPWGRRSTAGYTVTSTSATTPTRTHTHRHTSPPIAGDTEIEESPSCISSLVLARITFIAFLSAFAVALIFFFDDVKADLLLCLQWINGLGVFYGSLALTVANIIAALLFLPCLPFTLGAGFLYGTIVGTIVISIASTIAAVLPFLTSRYLARRVIEKQLLGPKGSRFRQIDHAIHSDGFRIVFLIRSSPLHPYGVCNYLFGLTSVTLKDYTIASFIGMLPATVMEVYFGTAMKNIADVIDGKFESSPASKIFFWGGLGITIIISASVSWWLKKKLSQELEKYTDVDEDIESLEDEPSDAPPRTKRIKIMSQRVTSTIEMATTDTIPIVTGTTSPLQNGIQQQQQDTHDISLTPSHTPAPSHHLHVTNLPDDEEMDDVDDQTQPIITTLAVPSISTLTSTPSSSTTIQIDPVTSITSELPTSCSPVRPLRFVVKNGKPFHITSRIETSHDKENQERQPLVSIQTSPLSQAKVRKSSITPSIPHRTHHSSPTAKIDTSKRA